VKTINQIEDHHKRENSVIYAVTYVTYVCNLRIAHPYSGSETFRFHLETTPYTHLIG